MANEQDGLLGLATTLAEFANNLPEENKLSEWFGKSVNTINDLIIDVDAVHKELQAKSLRLNEHIASTKTANDRISEHEQKLQQEKESFGEPSKEELLKRLDELEKQVKDSTTLDQLAEGLKTSLQTPTQAAIN